MLTWLISALRTAAGDVAGIKAVMTLAPVDSELPMGTEVEAVEPVLASLPTVAGLRMLANSADTTLATTVEPDSWLNLPPKGESEMNVGVELSFLENEAEMGEELRPPNRTLTLEAIVAVTGTTVLVVLCGPAAGVEDAPTLLDTIVTLFLMMVMGDSDP